MLFSILIPVYNVEEYLSECIESILDQEETDYEIILCDDGSTDSSGKICDSYAKKYPNIIRVIHKENEGLLLTLRCLMKNAKGNWLIFADSDDCLINNGLCELKKIIKSNNTDMIIYQAECIEKNKKSILKLDLKENYIYSGNELNNVYKQILYTFVINQIWLKAVKKDIIDLNEDYYKWKFVNFGTDIFTSLPLLDKAEKIYYLNKNLYRYIKRKNSITGSYKKNFYTVRKALWMREDFYFKKWNFTEQEILNDKVKRINSIIRYIIKGKSKHQFAQNISQILSDDYFINMLNSINVKLLIPRYRLYLDLMLKNKIDLCYYITRSEIIILKLAYRI